MKLSYFTSYEILAYLKIRTVSDELFQIKISCFCNTLFFKYPNFTSCIYFKLRNPLTYSYVRLYDLVHGHAQEMARK